MSPQISDTATDACGKYGALLSAIEVGLGSLLHGLHLPFSGTFLSLNQGFVLSRAAIKHREHPWARSMAAPVSLIVAILKSLSPAGKKLTPMLAISAQGLLFSTSTIVFGVNGVGILIGMWLLALWSFIQPVFIYYLFYGNTLVAMFEFYAKKVNDFTALGLNSFFGALALLVGVKLALSTVLTWAAFRFSDDKVLAIQERLIFAGRDRPAKPKTSSVPPVKGAMKDLFNRLFVVSLVLTALFLFYSEAPFSITVWMLLRPIAVGFVLFFLIRWVDWGKLLLKLDQTRFEGFGRALQAAAQSLKELSKEENKCLQNAKRS